MSSLNWSRPPVVQSTPQSHYLLMVVFGILFGVLVAWGFSAAIGGNSEDYKYEVCRSGYKGEDDCYKTNSVEEKDNCVEFDTHKFCGTYTINEK